ncbi:alpha/beta hydrolase [Halorientalis halophila]|uniref:alpha/beta hydrolase n=1 Tax=Halorientalis halophila TaxID=3108499 RepID=UPI003009973B
MFEDQPVRGELDGHVENMLDLLNDYDISLSEGTPEDSRNQLSVMTNLSTAEPEDVATVEDVEIPGPEDGQDPIPGRVYAPAGDGHPTVTYFHGGGFVAGDIETHDPLCRMLANRAEAVVVSVEYRKAPEAPWPKPIKDAYAGAQWAQRNADEWGADTGTHVVAGDSAGGNLAAVVSLMAAERGMPDIDRQVLLYPATTYMDPMLSRAENGEGFFLTAQDMLWFVTHYIEDEIDAHHPWAFPLNARRDRLAETPPAFVLTCGYDPLRDEGHAYAEELAEAGVDVEYSNHESMIHGFLNMEAIVDHTYDGVEEVAEQIRKA